MVRAATLALAYLATSPLTFAAALCWLARDSRWPHAFFAVCAYATPAFLLAAALFVRTSRSRPRAAQLFALPGAAYFWLGALHCGVHAARNAKSKESDVLEGIALLSSHLSTHIFHFSTHTRRHGACVSKSEKCVC